MEKQKVTAPPTNKALFHNLSDLFAALSNDEISIEKANALCNVAGKMQKSMEVEINRARTNFIIGEKVSPVREIELINPET